MKKKCILLASVLKPCNEPRMYEKMGLSLVNQGYFDVHIAGATQTNKSHQSKITFHQIHSGNNTMASRINSWLIFYKLCNRIRAEVVIISAPELLIAAVIYKLSSNCRIVYDVRENYYFNILHHKTHLKIFRKVLAKGLRSMENISSKYVNYYTLAEKSYVNELSFIKNKPYSVFENKFSYHKTLPTVHEKPHHFVFSGTVHKVTGVYQAINFVKVFRQYEPSATLKISGKAPKGLAHDLKHVSEKLSWLQTNVSENNIAYEDIIYDISEAEYVLASYPITDQNRDKIPTKFYEAIALNKKVIAQKNPYWQKEFNWECFYFFDFEESISDNDFSRIINLKTQRNAGTNFLWESEASRFVQIILSLDKP